MNSAAEAETALAEWKHRGEEHDAERDPLVRAAREAGLNINRIHKLSGVSRTTIYQILGLAAGTREPSSPASSRRRQAPEST